MTREEEIRNKAVNEQKTLMESMDWRAGFISGSKWADKHPIYVQGQTDEMQATEVEFTDWWFANNKEQPTYADTLEWMKERMIDKACEWIKENINVYAYKLEKKDFPFDFPLTERIVLIDNFDEDFKAAMEE